MTETTHDTAKLWDMIKSIEFAMMVTEDGGHLRSRPMAVTQKEFDGTLWFFTRGSAHKVTEVQDGHQVNLAFANTGSQDYVSVSGRAAIVRDRAEIVAHWSEPLKTWFPKGKEDPDIALIKVTVEMAEYWDAPSSTMVHAYGYVKSVLTGVPPSGGDNAKVSLS